MTVCPDGTGVYAPVPGRVFSYDRDPSSGAISNHRLATAAYDDVSDSQAVCTGDTVVVSLIQNSELLLDVYDRDDTNLLTHATRIQSEEPRYYGWHQLLSPSPDVFIVFGTQWRYYSADYSNLQYTLYQRDASSGEVVVNQAREIDGLVVKNIYFSEFTADGGLFATVVDKFGATKFDLILLQGCPGVKCIFCRIVL